MKFRIQAFDADGSLCKGIVEGRDEAHVREIVEASGYTCIAQCDRRPWFLPPNNPPGSTLVDLDGSEQFIPARPPRNVTLRTDAGLLERRLTGHVEMLGGAEYVQLWTCLALYVFTALAMWWFFPPLREVDLREWLSEEQHENAAGFNTTLMKSVILVAGNSTVTLLALMISLALKQKLTQTGLAVLAAYGIQWFACSGVLDAEGGAGGGMRFLAEYPVYTAMAWALPVVVMVGAERALRQLLEMTVPIYEDPETGKLEVGGRGVRAV